ncbi:MAG: dockerin type I repeat-containing protein, partial [Planctomycetota bacterium]
HFMDDAVWKDPRDDKWKELRDPIDIDGESLDLAFVITTIIPEEPGKPLTPHTKWSQPPIEIDPSLATPIYCGWDEESWTIDPCENFWFNTAADDFRCLGSMPASSIHWWGSHVGWEENEPPTLFPINGWLIRFFNNVPADTAADPNYSHPSQLLHEIWVDSDRVQIELVGNDEFPEKPPDTCFQYYVDLEPNEWFWQEDYLSDTTDDVFWISIQAVYPIGADPVFPWGWKTRAAHWMDDSVSYQCRMVGWSDDTTPVPIIVCRMWPIEDPVWGESFDLAFELDTEPNYIKWEQLFTGIRNWPHYEDELSMANVFRFTEIKWSQMPDLGPTTSIDVDATAEAEDPCMWPHQIIADDFNCIQTGPITDIHLYSSWFGDNLPEDDANLVTFTLSLHDDIPADDPTNPDSYSKPGDVRWYRTFGPGEFDVSLYQENLTEGWYSPCSDYYEQGVDTKCWKYDFFIDPCDAFHQEGSIDEPRIYWLDVQAKPHTADPWIRFGWKASIQHWNDDGVWGIGHEPFNGPWNELRYPDGHPDAEESIDLAFEITQETEVFNIQRLVADDWPCDANTPITAAVWWGSYIGNEYYACVGPQPTPTPPDYFLLNIWTDVPVDPNVAGSFSHPNEMVWEYKAYEYDEVMVGYDKHPEDQTGPPREPVFRYSVKLPEAEWFLQDTNDGIYWFSVVAVYDESTPDFDWGWTNHEHVYNDNAVAGVFDSPGGWSWQELYDQAGFSDMSFILFHEPLCFYPGMVDGCGQTITMAQYIKWISLGQPVSWCYPCHCRGDINNDCLINSTDILGSAIVKGWQYAWANRTTDYQPQADTNYDGKINSSDILGTGYGDGWSNGWSSKCNSIQNIDYLKWKCP